MKNTHRERTRLPGVILAQVNGRRRRLLYRESERPRDGQPTGCKQLVNRAVLCPKCRGWPQPHQNYDSTTTTYNNSAFSIESKARNDRLGVASIGLILCTSFRILFAKGIAPCVVFWCRGYFRFSPKKRGVAKPPKLANG
jgi:hypothetical protein